MACSALAPGATASRSPNILPKRRTLALSRFDDRVLHQKPCSCRNSGSQDPAWGDDALHSPLTLLEFVVARYVHRSTKTLDGTRLICRRARCRYTLIVHRKGVKTASILTTGIRWISRACEVPRQGPWCDNTSRKTFSNTHQQSTLCFNSVAGQS